MKTLKIAVKEVPAEDGFPAGVYVQADQSKIEAGRVFVVQSRASSKEKWRSVVTNGQLVHFRSGTGLRTWGLAEEGGLQWRAVEVPK